MNKSEKTALAVAAAGVGGWLLYQALKRPSFSFADKVVLVTGGSRGLGLVMARALARQGATIAICGRDYDTLERAADDLYEHGASPFVTTCDVRRPEDALECVELVEAECGPIDVLINNAGTICVGPMETMTREDFEDAIDVCFWGAYNMIEAALPSMKARGTGRIVNISSIGGKISVPHLLPYCVGKFALAGYSQGLRPELAKYGITVTSIFPGLMRTGSPRQAFFKGDSDTEFTLFKISDSLPIVTVSAEHAANDILEACRRGDAELIISIPAKVGAMLAQLCPEVTAELMAWAVHFLPQASEEDIEAIPGKEMEPEAGDSFLTRWTDQAAARNNEIDPEEKYAVEDEA